MLKVVLADTVICRVGLVELSSHLVNVYLSDPDVTVDVATIFSIFPEG
jgi:hypothetical protein